MDNTVYNSIRSVVLYGLGEVPLVGGLVSAICGELWGDQEQGVWPQIQGDVQALVGQALSTDMQNQAIAGAKSLRSTFYQYKQDLGNWPKKNATAQENADMLGSYKAAKQAFLTGNFLFQVPGYEVLLLPQFVQMANLHLALLRDGVTFGPTWGRTPADAATDRNDLYTQICLYLSWVGKWVIAGNPNAPYPTWSYAADTHSYLQWWSGQNAWRRQMNLTVLDFAALWPYFHPEGYPNGASVMLHREIYSDPQGQSDNSASDYQENLTVTTPKNAVDGAVYAALIDPYNPVPLAFSPITQVQSWSWTDNANPRLSKCTLSFADGSTLTSGLAVGPFNGGSDSNIVSAGTQITNVNSYTFIDDGGYYHDQTKHATDAYNRIYLHRFTCDTTNGSFTVGPTQSSPADYEASFNFPQHELSSIYMFGLLRSGDDGSDQGAAGALFGFKYAGGGTVVPTANPCIHFTSVYGFFVAMVSPDQSGLVTLWNFNPSFRLIKTAQLSTSGSQKITGALQIAPAAGLALARPGPAILPRADDAFEILYPSAGGNMIKAVVGAAIGGVVAVDQSDGVSSDAAAAGIADNYMIAFTKANPPSPGMVWVEGLLSDTWSSQFVQLGSCDRPALLSVNGTYYFAGRASDGSNQLMVASTATNLSFSGGARACSGYVLQGSPALAYNNGNFLVAFRANDGSNQLFIGMSSSWPFTAPPAPCAGIRLQGSPSMVTNGGVVYLVYQPCESIGDTYPFRVIKSTDGQNWYDAISKGAGRVGYVPSQDDLNGIGGGD
jgi:hypothetical protein